MSEIYTGKLAYPLSYNANEVLPPDEVSEYLGNLGFIAAWAANFYATDSTFNVRILIPGIGSGILAAGFLSERRRHIEANDPFAQFPVEMDVFDSDQAAVDSTVKALEPYEVADNSLKLNIVQGDWHDRATWDKFPGPYTVAMINPPYLTTNQLSGIRTGYETTPKQALLDESRHIFGLGQYAALLPRVAERIDSRPGAAIFGRFAVGRAVAEEITHMLEETFLTSGQHPYAHINVKSFQSNIWTDSHSRRSYSAFLVEPIGTVFTPDGGPVNAYQASEFIDPAVRHLLIPAHEPIIWMSSSSR